MSAEQTLQKLRNQLMSAALQAREDSIDKKNAAASKGKAEVEQLLGNLEALYRKNPEIFEPAVLSEIRTAKVCVGLISRSDLEQLENEPQKKAVISAHKAFLKKHRIGHKGTRLGFTTRAEPVCYVCNRSNDGSIDLECNICGWVICSCGACGCGLAKEKAAEKAAAKSAS
jgi:hypothetical protein